MQERADPPADPNAWIHRHRALREKGAMYLAIAVLVLGALSWLAKSLFSVRTGPGTPIGSCVRTDAHIATWIERLEPYVPSLARSGADDRFTLSVLIVPLRGGEPRLVRVYTGLTASASQLFRILGSDGTRLWIDGQRVHTIDLSTFALAPATGPVPTDLRGEPRDRMQQRPSDLLAAGYITPAGTWLGVHAKAEIERDYGPRDHVRRIVSAPAGRALRRLHRGTLEPVDGGRYFRVAAIAPLQEREYCESGFFRPGIESEPLRLQSPGGALLLYSSDADTACRLVAARITDDGEVRWSTDTGLDRFTLAQILPGEQSTAFVGSRPRVPDRVSEPLLVIVDHTTGAATVHSLWR